MFFFKSAFMGSCGTMLRSANVYTLQAVQEKIQTGVCVCVFFSLPNQNFDYTIVKVLVLRLYLHVLAATGRRMAGAFFTR